MNKNKVRQSQIWLIGWAEKYPQGEHQLMSFGGKNVKIGREKMENFKDK
jgi:hypothetical protein